MNTAPMDDARPAPAPREGELRVVYNGLLSDVYDLETAVRAVAEVRRIGGQPVRLWLVGIGPRAEALRALARELGVEDAVTFEGWVAPSDMPALLSRAHAMFAVLHDRPHQQLALPTKLFEGIARGLPVVTSRTAVVQDFVGVEDVLFVRPGDVEELALVFRGLADDPALAERIAAHAWDTAWPLRWQVQAANYVALLDRLSGRG